jgi:hypothetical protein
MALDNQQASIQVGQRVPRIVAASLGAGQQTNSTQSENVGLILNVTPRISPDGLVVMNIATEKSEVGPEAEGTPVSVAEGQVIRSPRINTTQAVTVVSAMTGQTVIIGGLISKSKLENHAKVPLLGDIPLLKYLFRYDSVTSSKKELLIIMSPHIVRNEAEMDAIKQAEAAKISWCLGDVVKIHGDAGLRGRTDDWSDSETQVVYPDAKPITGPDGKAAGAEAIPAPPGIPEDKLKSNSKSRTTAPQAPMPVPTPAPAGTATTGDPTSYIPPQQVVMGNVQQVSYQSVSTQPSGVPQSYNSR